MSRRFGRNQRRRAREALASAENEVAQLNDLVRLQRIDRDRHQADARQLRARVAVHERQMAACRQVLGDSIALPPVDQLVDSTRFRQLVEQGEMVPRSIPFDISPPSGRENEMTYMLRKMENDTIDAIEGGIEFDGGSALHRQMHAYLTTKQGAILYRVNLDSLAQIHRPEAVARVADMLSREFVDTLRRARR